MSQRLNLYRLCKKIPVTVWKAQDFSNHANSASVFTIEKEKLPFFGAVARAKGFMKKRASHNKYPKYSPPQKDAAPRDAHFVAPLG